MRVLKAEPPAATQATMPTLNARSVPSSSA
jgi:hypothetical protein